MSAVPLPAKVPADGPRRSWLPTGVWWDHGYFWWWNGKRWLWWNGKRWV